MLKVSVIVLLVILVVWAAPSSITNAMNVPFKLGDINENGEVVANSLWKPYYSADKKFSINYYDSEFLYPQNITETDNKIILDTLPMYILVTLKGPFYSDTDLQLHAFQIMNRHLIADENRTIFEDVHPVWTANSDMGYAYSLKNTHDGLISKLAFFDHDYQIYQIILVGAYSKNTIPEFDKTIDSIKLFD
jgi:hypothetical protein